MNDTKITEQEIARMAFAAEHLAGYQHAIELLRDSQKRARSLVDRQTMKIAADYLEAKIDSLEG